MIKTLAKNSPTALKMTKRAFDIARGKSFAECLKIEFGLSYAAIHTDFGEGEKQWFNLINLKKF